MLITHRDRNLKYPRAIKEEKVNIVLNWLLEFRFSSIEILSARIGQSATNANRFFNKLIDDKVIQPFKNVHTKNQRYVMMTSAGVSYLEATGVDVEKAVTRVANLGRYSQLIHDLSVQEVVLQRLDNYQEVVWDRHIDIDVNDRPDAILRAEKNSTDFWTAIEFERWRKDRKRIYITFMNHIRNFEKKLYAGVIYAFQSEADCKYYKKLFNEKDWPMFERKVKTGKIVNLNHSFEPDKIKNLRKRFVFRHEPVSF